MWDRGFVKYNLQNNLLFSHLVVLNYFQTDPNPGAI